MIFLEVVVAFAICLAFVAFGDVVSLITKAKIPALAASIIAYLIAIWFLGMPKEFPDVSGLAAIGNTFFIIFVAATATSVTPITMIREWRFLVIGLISVCTGMLFTIGIGGLLFDPREMFAGAMTTCGMGFTGGMIVIERLEAIGLTSMVTVPLLLASTMDAIGQPIGSFLTKKYVKKLIVSDAYLKTDKEKRIHVQTNKDQKLNRYGVPFNSPENPSPWFTAWIPPQYETEAVALFQIAIAVALGYWLGDITGLGWTLMLVIICQLGSLLGFFRLNMMDRTVSSGIIMAAIFTMVFQMLNDLTISAILDKLLTIIVIVVLSVLGLVVGGMLGAKLFGYDPWLGAASTIGLLYLFPGIKNIINEVSRSYARNDDEHAYLIEQLSAPSIITASMGGKMCLLVGTILMPILIK